MQKFFTSIALLGLLAAGCTKTDNLPENDTPGTDTVIEESTDYMTISILTAGGTGTRAGAPGNYEDGTSVENKVNSIRFYFFDENKAAALVRKNPDKTAASTKEEYDSFYDYEPMVGNEEGDGDESLTVEKTITVSMMVNLAPSSRSGKPKYVVAILNPTKEALVDNPSLTDLEKIAADFLPGTDGNFIMSNSVYMDVVDGGKIKFNYTELNPNALCKSVEDALNPDNQTVIYVERVTARLDLTVGKNTEVDNPIQPAGEENGFEGENAENVYYTGMTYKAYDYGASEEAEEEEPIFVKFLGWTVTSTPKKSNLLKNINTEWSDALFGSFGGSVKEPWNVPTYHRSFWGMNPSLVPANNKNTTSATATTKTDYQFYSYNEIAKDKTSFEASMYIAENAAELNKNTVLENHESKVIVAARLVDKKGNPMPVVEYGFKYYAKDDLLQYFADQLALHFHTKENVKLSKADLVYKTQAAHKGDAGVAVPGGYFSYVALSKDGAEKTWYLDDGEGAVSTEKVNQYIENMLDGRLLIWEEGQTYYYFTIRHLGALAADGTTPGPGYHGVVRNHIYKADITTLAGLGTPVLDPDETIYPEEPTRDGHILAAEIKVLQWRVVSQDYEFSW